MAELILVNSIADLLAGFMPVPGGMGVAEAAYTRQSEPSQEPGDVG